MKTLKTIELTGDDLLAAVAKALRKSYADLAILVRDMSLDQLCAHLAKHHPLLDLSEVDTGSAEQLRDVILSMHEPLLADENDLVQAGEWDLWPLCEHLLDRYVVSLSPRIDVTRHKVWLADDDNLRIAGDTPREAILRYYVTIKLGQEVTLND
ncbi:hypothetical protein [Burkholderia ubonensis]|uniref:hypothetical protein n=1 Tax=Burkholderia ubonensis TaxID=101571 RepID=UPI00075B20CC|nr:hypothetical protein [Burkholderia ubonensis]KVP40020.1 hypothetical protein WJ87_07510 [Burkholderia ubonensis]